MMYKLDLKKLVFCVFFFKEDTLDRKYSHFNDKPIIKNHKGRLSKLELLM